MFLTHAELVCLMDLSRTINHMRMKGIENQDLVPDVLHTRALMKAMDADIRVVLQYDTDMVDVELHVFEPEEHCYSFHK